MPRANPGEVWIIDLGLAAKVRPCLILSDYPRDDELSLIVVIPHTTAVRNNRWELAIPKRFLKPGVFHLQQIQSIPIVRLKRKIGALTPDEFRGLRERLIDLLQLAPRPNLDAKFDTVCLGVAMLILPRVANFGITRDSGKIGQGPSTPAAKES